MAKVWRQLVGLGGLAMVLAACGAAPDLPVATPHADPTPVPLTPPDPRQATARSLLAAVSRQVDQTRTWTATCRSECIATNGDRDYNVARLSYRRPGVCAVTILEARQDKKAGTRLVYDGVDSVAVKTYLFGLIPLRVTLHVDDDRLLDAYKRSIKDTSTEQMLGVMLNPQTQVVPLGTYRLGDETVALLEFHSPVSWKGVSREVIGISQRTVLPILRDVYDRQNRRMFHMELAGMRTNVALPSSEFSLE